MRAAVAVARRPILLNTGAHCAVQITVQCTEKINEKSSYFSRRTGKRCVVFVSRATRLYSSRVVSTRLDRKRLDYYAEATRLERGSGEQGEGRRRGAIAVDAAEAANAADAARRRSSRRRRGRIRRVKLNDAAKTAEAEASKRQARRRWTANPACTRRRRAADLINGAIFRAR